MRVASYSRVSTSSQAQKDKVSIEMQVDWAKKICQEKNWQYVKKYIEPGVIGETEFEERQAGGQLLKDAKQKFFDLVLFYHSSRLAREPDIGLRTIRLLGQNKIQVYFGNSPTEPVAPEKYVYGNNVSSMFMNAFSLVTDLKDNYERAEKFHGALRKIASRGIFPIRVPFGYKRIFVVKNGKPTRKIVTVPEDAIIIKMIFDLYDIEKKSIRSIAHHLNTVDIKSPSGKTGLEAWTHRAVRYILKNPTYTGLIRWGRMKGRKYQQERSISGAVKRIHANKDEIILAKGTHEVLINKKQFNRVQARLQLRGKIPGRSIGSPGLLSGLVFCGRCKKRAYFVTKRDKNSLYTKYVCRSYVYFKTCRGYIISAPKLDKIVINEIAKLTKGAETPNKYINASVKNKIKNLKDTQSKLKNSLESNIKKQNRIFKAYENEVINLTEFSEEKKQLDKDNLRLTMEVENIDKEIQEFDDKRDKSKNFKKLIKNFPKTFAKISPEKQKSLIHQLIEKITVNGESVHIEYRV